MRAPPESLS
jgi:hypothetical protein